MMRRMSDAAPFALATAATLAAMHLAFPRVDDALRDRRSWWIPLGGGLALGYVFLYLFPKLSDYTALIMAAEPGAPEFLHYRVYLWALGGLLAYLVIEVYRHGNALRSARWAGLQGLGFGVYSFLVGYSVAELPRPGVLPHLLVLVALGPHLMAVDHQLRDGHRGLFDRRLRWLFASALLAGTFAGLASELPKSLVIGLNAFIGGAILINVMTEELPGRSRGGLLPFLGGVGFFLLIDLSMRSIPRVDP